uniref:Uncharacterized protein n=1 Tax=Avena sativa TaxID=4498 RepID=A0ACD6AFP8_AVESA
MASRCLIGVQAMVLSVTLVFLSLTRISLAARRLPDLQQAPASDGLSYHGGAVLHGDIPVTIVWYGQFKPAQKAIVVDFILSLTSTSHAATPSAAQWWGTIDSSYLQPQNATNSNAPSSTTRVLLAGQVTDERYSLGKSLSLVQIFQLAAATLPEKGSVVAVLTDRDVVVEGLCSARCGVHGADAGAGYAYAWVGDAGRACPGQCAWPFARPAYGPQDEPLAPPNGDVGADGMVATLAGVLADAVTNPFGDGFYQGEKDAALEVCAACAGMYGSGAYPGYPGKVLVDETTGGSYNAFGANGRKYLLPAVYDRAKQDCSTLV